MEQIEAYKEYLMVSGQNLMKQMRDFDYLLAVGETVHYGGFTDN
jgi:acyl-CoA dehydrogenase